MRIRLVVGDVGVGGVRGGDAEDLVEVLDGFGDVDDLLLLEVYIEFLFLGEDVRE